jgi:hypothetical protein
LIIFDRKIEVPRAGRSEITDRALDPDVPKLPFERITDEACHIGHGKEQREGKITPGHVSLSQTEDQR